MTTTEHRDRARELAISMAAFLLLGVITLWLPKRSVYEAKRELAATLYEQKELFSERQQEILRKASKSLLYAGKNIHVWETEYADTTYIGGGSILWHMMTSVEGSDIQLEGYSWTKKRAEAIEAVLNYQHKVGWMFGVLGVLCRNLLILFMIYQIYDWIRSVLYIRRSDKKSEEAITIT